jgi:hypothetical protein
MNEGAFFRVISPILGNPLPGLRARPLPKGEVTPENRTEAEPRDIFINAPGGWWV